MHYNGVHSHQLHQHDVSRKTLLQICIRHRVAAQLDDKGLAGEALNVRQRFGQDASKITRFPLI